MSSIKCDVSDDLGWPLGTQCIIVDFAWSSVVRSIGVSRYTCLAWLYRQPWTTSVLIFVLIAHVVYLLEHGHQGWARDVNGRNRGETETLKIFVETRPSRDVKGLQASRRNRDVEVHVKLLCHKKDLISQNNWRYLTKSISQNFPMWQNDLTELILKKTFGPSWQFYDTVKW